MHDPYFWFIAILAAFIVGLSKSGLVGGLGFMAVPMLALVMPARDATGMLLPVLLAMDAIAVYIYRREANWRVIAIMVPGALVGTLIGWALWSVVSDAAVLFAVGVITLLFVLDSVLPLRKVLAGLPPSRPWGTFWGGVAGLTSFISHTGGPPFQIYTLPQRMEPRVYAATTAFFFAILNTAKLVPFYFLGQLSVSNLELAAVLAPVGIAGVLIGAALVRRISVKLFYQLAYVLVFGLALKLIWDGAWGIFAGAA
jgi:uncharacterized protein